MGRSLSAVSAPLATQGTSTAAHDVDDVACAEALRRGSVAQLISWLLCCRIRNEATWKAHIAVVSMAGLIEVECKDLNVAEVCQPARLADVLLVVDGGNRVVEAVLSESRAVE